MDADTPKLKINVRPYERDEARARYTVDFDIARAREAADKDRRVAENDALNKIQPSDKFNCFPALA